VDLYYRALLEDAYYILVVYNTLYTLEGRGNYTNAALGTRVVLYSGANSNTSLGLL